MEIMGTGERCKRQWNSFRLFLVYLTVFDLIFGAGCAQVPKESVELSTTVGRDIAQVYRMHRELALILYERIKDDVNRFVDDVYAPYQIEKLLQADHEDFKNGDPESLFSALDTAIEGPNNPEAQKTALLAMDIFIQVVRAEVEAYRRERLAPILAQEKEVLSAIDRSYNQIHYANSIVTGHLASIVKVHDAQEELLNEFGIEGLREEIGQKLSATSSSIAAFAGKAKRLEGTVEEMKMDIEKLTEQLDALTSNTNVEEAAEP